MYGPSYQYAAEIRKIVDGDTYDMMVDLGFDAYQKIRVRLKDFDTPETYRPRNAAEKAHGEAAKAFVTTLIPVGTEVVIFSSKVTAKEMAAYGRWEANVYYVDPKTGAQLSVADVLGANGFAKRQSYALRPSTKK